MDLDAGQVGVGRKYNSITKSISQPHLTQVFNGHEREEASRSHRIPWIYPPRLDQRAFESNESRRWLDFSAIAGIHQLLLLFYL